MGYRISYLLAQTDIESAIGAFGLSEINRSPLQPTDEAPFWATQLRKTGWTLIWAKDEQFFAQREARVAELSQNGPVISCVVNEPIMASGATYWMGGANVWSISHQGDGRATNLDVSGTPPPLFEAVRDRAADEQAENGSCGHFFEIPLNLAAMETGFRQDAALQDNEVGEYLRLTAPNKSGFFARFLGRR